MLLTAEDRVRDDSDFVFYNQPRAPGVEYRTTDGSTGVIHCDLAALPTEIERVSVVASLDGSGPSSFGSLGSCEVEVLGPLGTPIATFELPTLASETAVLFVDLYRRSGEWKVRAVGQGWTSGLAGIATSFGVDVGGAAPPGSPTAPPPPSAPAPAPVLAPTGSPAVKLGKVTLEKRGASRKVSLTKGGPQVLHFNLNWTQQPPRKGLFSTKAATSADLDLGCMVEMMNGLKAVIQPLGESFGHRDAPPYIYLDKDDRSGGSDGENLYVLRPDLIRRVLVFAMIYEGAPDFNSVGATLTIRDHHDDETIVALDNPDRGLTWCAICTVSNDGDAIHISKEERYFAGAGAGDKAFGFGFSWKPGRK